MILKNLSKNTIIAEKLKKAISLSERMKGLIPLDSMPDQFALWIPYCNSVHSFFMKFKFDVLFVDKKMRVKKCYSEVIPNRILFPVFGAKDAIELKSGSIKELNIEIGDQLHVVD